MSGLLGPDTPYVVMPKAHHHLFLEQPIEFVRVLRTVLQRFTSGPFPSATVRLLVSREAGEAAGVVTGLVSILRFSMGKSGRGQDRFARSQIDAGDRPGLLTPPVAKVSPSATQLLLRGSSLPPQVRCPRLSSAEIPAARRFRWVSPMLSHEADSPTIAEDSSAPANGSWKDLAAWTQIARSRGSERSRTFASVAEMHAPSAHPARDPLPRCLGARLVR